MKSVNNNFPVFVYPFYCLPEWHIF